MPYTNMWEVTDKTGTIHSGTEEEMKEAFNVMRNHNSIPAIQECYNLSKNDAMALIEKYYTEWTGDLRLVQIHDVTN